jgi:hypothetical protein
LRCGIHQKPVWTEPDVISAYMTSFTSSILAEQRWINHLQCTSSSVVTTTQN